MKAFRLHGLGSTDESAGAFSQWRFSSVAPEAGLIAHMLTMLQKFARIVSWYLPYWRKALLLLRGMEKALDDPCNPTAAQPLTDLAQLHPTSISCFLNRLSGWK
jgi:hypothetical protein